MTAGKKKQTEVLFSKEQLLASERFSKRRDLVEALLDENKQYTMEGVEQMMEKFMKGKVTESWH